MAGGYGFRRPIVSPAEAHRMQAFLRGEGSTLEMSRRLAAGVTDPRYWRENQDHTNVELDKERVLRDFHILFDVVTA